MVTSFKKLLSTDNISVYQVYLFTIRIFIYKKYQVLLITRAVKALIFLTP